MIAIATEEGELPLVPANPAFLGDELDPGQVMSAVNVIVKGSLQVVKVELELPARLLLVLLREGGDKLSLEGNLQAGAVLAWVDRDYLTNKREGWGH